MDKETGIEPGEVPRVWGRVVVGLVVDVVVEGVVVKVLAVLVLDALVLVEVVAGTDDVEVLDDVLDDVDVDDVGPEPS